MNYFLEKIFKLQRFTKVLIQVSCDATVISLCFLMSMAMRLDSMNFIVYYDVWKILLIIVPLTLLIYFLLGFYKAIIRYISEKIALTVGISTILSSFLLYIISIQLGQPIPRSVPFIYFTILFISTTGIRICIKNIYLLYRYDNRKPIAIYGAGTTGRQIVKYLNESLEYKPVFFIDDNAQLFQTKIDHLNVYNLQNFEKELKKNNVKTILLAMPSLSFKQKQNIIKKINLDEIDLKTIPNQNDIFNSKEKILKISNLSIEELIGREEIPAIDSLLNKHISKKIVLVSGAGGSIGTELCRQIIKLKPKYLICLDNSEFALYRLIDEIEKNLTTYKPKTFSLLGSIQDKNFLKKLFKNHKIDTIYHAAAYKHVPIIENNQIEGIKNNVLGTYNLTNCAIKFKVKNFILISSDKAVRPKNYMGMTKRISELICQSLSTQNKSCCFSIVRFGNVIGSSGSVIPKFENQILKGGPVTVTHKEVTRYFMTIKEAAGLVIQAGALGKSGNVFVLDMGKPIKILNLAKKMIKIYGFIPTLKKIKSKNYIRISITGLRPGEKLYEELFIGSKVTKTEHSRILKIQEKSINYKKLITLLKQLDNFCKTRNINKINDCLKNISNDLKFNVK